MSDWLGVTGIVKAVGQRTTNVADRQQYFDKLVNYVKQAPLEHVVFKGLTFEVTVIDDVANRLADHADYASEAQNLLLAFNASFRDCDLDDADLVLNWLNHYLSDDKTQSALDLFLVQGIFNVMSGFDTKTYAYADDFVREQHQRGQSWYEL